MPWRYVIYPERQLIITTMWNRITFLDVLHHQDQLKNDTAFNPELDQFIDAAGVSALDISRDEAIRLASTNFLSPASRRAVVATEPAVFGLARLMEAHYHIATGNQRTAVFYEQSSAMEWLEQREASEKSFCTQPVT